jgi:hypothetical protein
VFKTFNSIEHVNTQTHLVTQQLFELEFHSHLPKVLGASFYALAQMYLEKPLCLEGALLFAVVKHHIGSAHLSILFTSIEKKKTFVPLHAYNSLESNKEEGGSKTRK